ncbi:MAG: DHH family phosphoesterase [Promethearchaeota archaeon]
MTTGRRERAYVAHLEMVAAHFADQSFERVYSISHNDADGIASSQVVQLALRSAGVRNKQLLFDRRGSWANYLAPMFEESESLGEKAAFVFSDLGGNLEELSELFSGRTCHAYVLDHHELDPNLDLGSLPENLHVANPTSFGLDGLKEVAGAAVNYLFAKELYPNVRKHSWLAVLGIAGDSLMSVDALRSINREVYEEALREGSVEDLPGLTLMGASHDTIKNALRLSLLPFLKRFGGNAAAATAFLKQLGINPNKRAALLDEDEIALLQDNLEENVTGSLATFPRHHGLFHFAFEFAVALNVVGFHSKHEALELSGRRNITDSAKKLYYSYVEGLVANLSKVVRLPAKEVGDAILVNVTGQLPKSSWSDTASFASVNEVFDPLKVLFLAGREDSHVKFSIRCTEKYLAEKGYGVDSIIRRLLEKVPGSGGGHKLAGGLRINAQHVAEFKDALSVI